MVYSSVSIPWLAEHTVSINDVAKQFVCLARTRLLYQILGHLPRLDAFATMKPDNNIWYKNSRRVPATPEIFQKRSFFSLRIRPTVHTKLSRKRSFSKTLFKLEEFENAGFAF